MIYFIQAGDSGAIKIGVSENPKRRVGKIQSDCPHRLSVLAIIDGGVEHEAALHKRFKGSRGVGEWFMPTADLLGFIAGLNYSPEAIKRSRKRLPGLLGDYLYEHELTLETFGRRVGISGAQVSRLISAPGFLPSLSTAYAIQCETQGRVPMESWLQPERHEAAA